VEPAGRAGRWLAFAIALATVLYLLLAQSIFVYAPDDTYITLRYAQNLAEGYGPVFNRDAPASDRTEGFSCPLFMALLALCARLPFDLDLLLYAKLLGLLSGLGILLLLPGLAARCGLPVWAQAALPILVATHSSFVVSGVDGMETQVAAFLATLATVLFLREGDSALSERRQRATGFASGLAFAGCALIRPEGLLYGLLATGLLLWEARLRLGRREVTWLLAFVLPVVAYFLWRRSFYGLWLPNTYYAKQIPIDQGLLAGGVYLARTFFKYVNENALYLALGAGWWLLVVAGALSERFQQPPRRRIVLGILAAQLCFILRAGGDWMGGWRFMGPALPLAMLLSVSGIVEAAQGLRRLRVGAVLERAVAGALAATVLFACLRAYPDYWANREDGYVSWQSYRFTTDLRALNAHRSPPVFISDWLNANLPPGSVVAYTEMGLTPYLSPGIRFLDTRGLTDHAVAVLPGARHQQVGVIDSYTSADNPVGRYLREVGRPDFIIQGVPTPRETILDGAYPSWKAVPFPVVTPQHGSYLMVWKRAEGQG
jgi:hypothetical protein